MKHDRVNNDKGIFKAERFGLLLLIGGLVIVGGVFLLVWQVLAQRSQPPTSNSGNSSYTTAIAQNTVQSQVTSTGDANPPVLLPTTYKTLFEEQVAQKLHISIAQIKAKLLQPQTTLFMVMVAQGVARENVFPTWIDMMDTVTFQLVQSNVWTKIQARDNMNYWRSRQAQEKSMDSQLSSWFTDNT